MGAVGLATDDPSHVVGPLAWQLMTFILHLVEAAGRTSDDLPHVIGVVGLAVFLPEVVKFTIRTIHVGELGLILLVLAVHTPHCKCEDNNEMLMKAEGMYVRRVKKKRERSVRR